MPFCYSGYLIRALISLSAHPEHRNGVSPRPRDKFLRDVLQAKQDDHKVLTKGDTVVADTANQRPPISRRHIAFPMAGSLPNHVGAVSLVLSPQDGNERAATTSTPPASLHIGL